MKFIGNLGLFVNISVMEYVMEFVGYVYGNKVYFFKVRVDCWVFKFWCKGGGGY